MALVHLEISYKADTDEMKADIIVNGQRTDSKRLTNAEMDGLSDHIDFSAITEAPHVFPAQDVYRWVTEECWFDTNGEQTNLELMLEEYLA